MAFLGSFSSPTPARLTSAVITSDKSVLCKPFGLKSLDFFDTLQAPQKAQEIRPCKRGC